MQHWRLIALTALAGAILLYVHGAEAAKRDLAAMQDRADLAKALVQVQQRRADSLTKALAEVTARVAAVDSQYVKTRRTLGRRRVIIVDSFPMPRDTAIDNPQAGDTVAVADLPEVKQILADCEARVALRDTVIKWQESRHMEESSVIEHLEAIIASQRPRKQSPWKTVLKVAAGVAIVGVVAGAHR